MAKPSPAADTEDAVPDSVSQRVGQRIRHVRQERGLSLAQLGGKDLTRGFLSSVELGRSSISLQALALVARRLGVPIAYFVDDAPERPVSSTQLSVNHAAAALAYGFYLRNQGKTAEALEYALWAAQAVLPRSDDATDCAQPRVID